MCFLTSGHDMGACQPAQYSLAISCTSLRPSQSSGVGYCCGCGSSTPWVECEPAWKFVGGIQTKKTEAKKKTYVGCHQRNGSFWKPVLKLMEIVKTLWRVAIKDCMAYTFESRMRKVGWVSLSVVSSLLWYKTSCKFVPGHHLYPSSTGTLAIKWQPCLWWIAASWFDLSNVQGQWAGTRQGWSLVRLSWFHYETFVYRRKAETIVTRARMCQWGANSPNAPCPSCAHPNTLEYIVELSTSRSVSHCTHQPPLPYHISHGVQRPQTKFLHTGRIWPFVHRECYGSVRLTAS